MTNNEKINNMSVEEKAEEAISVVAGIKTPIMALDIFTKTWCIDYTIEDGLAFRCDKCEFKMDNGKCMIKCFKCSKAPNYKDFGSMGDL